MRALFSTHATGFFVHCVCMYSRSIVSKETYSSVKRDRMCTCLRAHASCMCVCVGACVRAHAYARRFLFFSVCR